VTAGSGQASPAGRVLVVGLGHPDRGDDGVGPAVARQVARLVGTGVTVLEQADPAGLLDTWAGARLVVVTDAVQSGRRPPGTVQVLHACHGPLPVRMGAGGTHGFGLAEVIELGRALGRMPPELVIVGVEAQQFGIGEPLSPPVAAAVEMAARTVADVVQCA
jgi:hydrogenase maturation protease